MKRKHILYLIFFTILCLVVPFNVKALGTSISGPSTITSGQQFTLTFNMSGASDLWGMTATLSYDSSKLSIVSADGLNGMTLTRNGGTLVLDTNAGKNGNLAFMSVTFKANSSFTQGTSTSVSLSNVVWSSGSGDVSGTGSSINISMPVPKSSNNNLSSLNVNGTSVNGFNAGTTTYRMNVNNNVTSVSITASAADSKASVSGARTYNLNVYANTIYVTVTAENGSTKTYTIVINRRDANGNLGAVSNNNNLSNLSVDGYNIGFNAGTTSYTLNVANTVSSVNVTATVAHANARVVINNPGALNVGENTITAVVTAEDDSKKTYTIKVIRLDDIPVATIDTAINALDKTTKDSVVIEIKDDNNVITKEILEKAKSTNKNLIIRKYSNETVLYEWTLIASNLNIDEFNSLINFSTENKDSIDKLTNYAIASYITFEYKDSLPKETSLKIYVGDKFKSDEIIYLYEYVDEKIKLVNKSLNVVDGYVTLENAAISEYLLIKSVLSDEVCVDTKINNYIGMIAIAELIIIVSYLVCVLFTLKHKKEYEEIAEANRRNNLPEDEEIKPITPSFKDSVKNLLTSKKSRDTKEKLVEVNAKVEDIENKVIKKIKEPVIEEDMSSYEDEEIVRSIKEQIRIAKENNKK